MNLEERLQRSVLDKIDDSLNILQNEISALLPANFVNVKELKGILLRRIQEGYKYSSGDVSYSNVLVVLGDSEENSPIMVANIVVYRKIRSIFQALCDLLDKILENEEEKLKKWVEFITDKTDNIYVDYDALIVVQGIDPKHLKAIKFILNVAESLLEKDDQELQMIVESEKEGSFLYDLSMAFLEDPSLREFVKHVLSIENVEVLEKLLKSKQVREHKWQKPLIAIITARQGLLSSKRKGISDNAEN